MTKSQARILELVAAHVEQYSYPPTVRELCELVGLSSPSSVHRHLIALEREGYIERDASKPRALRILVHPWMESAA